MSDSHTDADAGKDDSTTYTYNSDDELTEQVSTLNGETDFTYDDNGSETSSTNGTNVTTYGYDVRNKMVSATTPTSTATYVDDDAGNRVGETVNGATTLYLTDDANPTGYAQPIEAKTSATAAPTITYLIGDRVFGQTDASGTVSYLLTDGHGSTLVLTDATGVATQDYAYTAFGGSIGFVTDNAGTQFLFGGDAVYDPASGLYLHGDGIRGSSGFRFTEADEQGYSSSAAPLSLNVKAPGFALVTEDVLGINRETFGVRTLRASTNLIRRGSLLRRAVAGIYCRAKAARFPIYGDADHRRNSV